jgi:hypothetical protein
MYHHIMLSLAEKMHITENTKTAANPHQSQMPLRVLAVRQKVGAEQKQSKDILRTPWKIMTLPRPITNRGAWRIAEDRTGGIAECPKPRKPATAPIVSNTVNKY